MYARFKRVESAREILFVPLLVVLETVWVLESAYDKSRKEILDAFDELSSMSILEFEKVHVLQDWLSEGSRSNADLSDLLIALAAQSCGCQGMFTFDKKALKFPFFQLLT